MSRRVERYVDDGEGMYINLPDRSSREVTRRASGKYRVQHFKDGGLLGTWYALTQHELITEMRKIAPLTKWKAIRF